MRLVAFISWVAVTLSAQTIPPVDALSSIEGRVTSALTGEPVKKASLFLHGSESNASRTTFSTVSDADGRFSMKAIEPGSYRLWAERSGFLTTEYGARTQPQRGTLLVLKAGETTRELHFALTPQAVISGRVLDEDDEPVVSAQIQLYRLEYSGGRKQLQPQSAWPAVITNDLGEYRVFGLRPGRYSVSATFRSRNSQTIDRSAASRKHEEYVPTYHPGTPDPSSAILFDVGAGAEARGVDVKLVKVRAVRVRGTVINNAVPGRAEVRLSLESGDAKSGGIWRRSYDTEPSGQFEIKSVAAGSYTLVATASNNDKDSRTRVPLEVQDQDIDDLKLVISPGPELVGHVVSEGNELVDSEHISFNLMSVDGDGDGYAKLNQDHSFRFGSTLPGHYYLRPNLPGGLYVKAALAGEVDILASGLDLSSEASAPLEVVMNSHPARIVGTVRDPETRRAASFAIVVLVPQEAGRREQSWYYATSTADRSGNFNFKNVPPGNYRAYAWDEVEDGAYMDADFLKAFEANAVDVSLKEGDQVSKDLDVSSSATILGTARRRP
jgi:hypothetical protein